MFEVDKKTIEANASTAVSKAWFTLYVFFLLTCTLMGIGYLILGVFLGLIGWSAIGANLSTRISLFVISGAVELVTAMGFYSARTSSSNRIAFRSSRPEKESTVTTSYIVALRVLISSCFVLSITTIVISDPLKEHMTLAMTAMQESENIPGETISYAQWMAKTYQSIFGCRGSNVTAAKSSETDEIRLPGRRWKNHGKGGRLEYLRDTTQSPSPEETQTLATASSDSDSTVPPSRSQVIVQDCHTAITKWLTCSGILLSITGSMLFMLHVSWCIWRRKSRLPILCLDDHSGSSAVRPINNSAKMAPTSLLEDSFLAEQASRFTGILKAAVSTPVPFHSHSMESPSTTLTPKEENLEGKHEVNNQDLNSFRNKMNPKLVLGNQVMPNAHISSDAKAFDKTEDAWTVYSLGSLEW